MRALILLTAFALTGCVTIPDPVMGLAYTTGASICGRYSAIDTKNTIVEDRYWEDEYVVDIVCKDGRSTEIRIINAYEVFK